MAAYQEEAGLAAGTPQGGCRRGSIQRHVDDGDEVLGFGQAVGRAALRCRMFVLGEMHCAPARGEAEGSWQHLCRCKTFDAACAAPWVRQQQRSRYGRITQTQRIVVAEVAPAFVLTVI